MLVWWRTEGEVDKRSGQAGAASCGRKERSLGEASKASALCSCTAESNGEQHLGAEKIQRTHTSTSNGVRKFEGANFGCFSNYALYFALKFEFPR